MLYTFFRHIDTSNYDHQAAHLFEHLYINGFKQYLVKHNIMPELVGWVGGESFEKDLFFDIGLYNKRTLFLLEEYIKNIPKFSKQEIKRELQVLMCEDKSRLEVSDWTSLMNQLKQLSELLKKEGHSSIGQKFKSFSESIKQQKDSKKFRDIVVEVRADPLNKEEQKLMLRFRTILFEIFDYRLQEEIPIYYRGWSHIKIIDNGVGFLAKYTITRGESNLNTIKEIAQASIRDFNYPAAMPAIDDHFKTFADQSTWQSMPIDFYRDTGLVTTNKEVASLATIKNIESIINKIKVDTFAYHKTLDSYF